MGQPDCLPQALPQRLVRAIVLLYVGALLRSDAGVQADALVYGRPGDSAAHPRHAGLDLVLEAEEHSAGRGPVPLRAPGSVAMILGGMVPVPVHEAVPVAHD